VSQFASLKSLVHAAGGAMKVDKEFEQSSKTF
jgi:hypothetical protein